MRPLQRDWNEFWFRPTSPGPLGLMRIAFGILTMAAALQLWPDRFAWFSEHGVLPSNISDQFDAVYTPGPRLADILNGAPDSRITAFFVVYMVAIVFMTIGLWTKPAMALVWYGLSCIHNRNAIVNSTGYDGIMIITIIYLFFTQSDAAFSVRRLLRVWGGKEASDAPSVSIWPQRLMQIQVSIVYLCTFLSKLGGEYWQNGTAVYYPYSVPEFHRFPVPFMAGDYKFPLAFLNGNQLWFINLATYGTLAIELSLATLVWVPRLRLYVLALGILLHAGIEYSMNIPLFGWLMASSYIAFLNQGNLRQFAAWLKKRLRLTPLRVVYDGECDFCRSVVLMLNVFDIFRLLTFLDCREPDQLREAPGVALEDADLAAIAMDARGRRYQGFTAFREIARRCPFFWIAVPFLYIPGITHLGVRVYAWVAANRRRFPVAPPS